MNTKKLEKKVDELLINLICAAGNRHYIHLNGKAPAHEKIFTEQYSVVKKNLIELLEIKTHKHEKTDIFVK